MFKVGDKVRLKDVIKSGDVIEDYEIYPCMMTLPGEVFEVKGVTSFEATLGSCYLNNFFYPWGALELVEEAPDEKGRNL